MRKESDGEGMVQGAGNPPMIAPNVQYIARLTCACGATVETECLADTKYIGCGEYVAELTHDNPDDWFGGYDGKPVQCGPCLRREIDQR